MSAREEIRAALMEIPVSWLHIPALAAADGALPRGKGAPPQPKIAPIVAAGIGVAVGAGIQLGHQYLNKSKSFAPVTTQVGRLACTLTLKEIEDNATRIYEGSQKTKSGGPLNAIVNSVSGDAKVAPAVVAAGYFLAGVAAGAAAARD